MSIFDTHSHYNMDPFVHKWQEELAAAQEKSVKKSLIIGIDYDTSVTAQTIALQHESLFASIGFHPTECETIESDDKRIELQAQLDALMQLPKVIAVGETGLDYYRLPIGSEAQKRNQLLSFIIHIKLANAYNVPLILHVRDQKEDAYKDTLKALKTYKADATPFILHCVSGPLDYIQEALSMGGYVSTAGNITYKNAEHIRNLVALVPDDKLLIETDAPFLPPHPHRGKTCEPWMISLTAEYVQNELNRNLEQIYQNSLKVFNLIPTALSETLV